MIESAKAGRGLSGLVVPYSAWLVSTYDEWEPYHLLDAEGTVVDPVAVFLRELLAAGKSVAALRSYGMDLLRWWRFLHAVDVCWDRATRLEPARPNGVTSQCRLLQRLAMTRSH